MRLKNEKRGAGMVLKRLLSPAYVAQCCLKHYAFLADRGNGRGFGRFFQRQKIYRSPVRTAHKGISSWRIRCCPWILWSGPKADVRFSFGDDALMPRNKARQQGFLAFQKPSLTPSLGRPSISCGISGARGSFERGELVSVCRLPSTICAWRAGELLVPCCGVRVFELLKSVSGRLISSESVTLTWPFAPGKRLLSPAYPPLMLAKS